MKPSPPIDYDVPSFVSEIQEVIGPVLELMAGTGRLSLPRGTAGYNGATSYRI